VSCASSPSSIRAGAFPRSPAGRNLAAGFAAGFGRRAMAATLNRTGRR
jgi:hypothetical protein